MSEYTKGPWRVEHDSTLVWGACDPDDKSTYGMGYPVASALNNSRWQQPGPNWQEAVANAHLIAAAPTMKRALLALVEALEDGNDEAVKAAVCLANDALNETLP